MSPVVIRINRYSKLIKPEYREVVLQPTGLWEDGRTVWSTVSGIELHLYNDAKGRWQLSDTCTPGESDIMAYFSEEDSEAPREAVAAPKKAQKKETS